MNPSANKGGCDFQTETHLCGRQPGHTGEHYLVAKLMPPTSGLCAICGTNHRDGADHPYFGAYMGNSPEKKS